LEEELAEAADFQLLFGVEHQMLDNWLVIPAAVEWFKAYGADSHVLFLVERVSHRGTFGAEKA